MISRATSGRRAQIETRDPPSARIFAKVVPQDPAPSTATRRGSAPSSRLTRLFSRMLMPLPNDARGGGYPCRMGGRSGAARRWFAEFARGFGSIRHGFAFWRVRPGLMALGLLPAVIVAVVLAALLVVLAI